MITVSGLSLPETDKRIGGDFGFDASDENERVGRTKNRNESASHVINSKHNSCIAPLVYCMTDAMRE